MKFLDCIFGNHAPTVTGNMAASTEATYAAKAGKEFPTQNAVGGKPVFIKNKDIASVREKQMSNENMYKCLISDVNGREIKGIQKIGGLWRIYVENQESRIKLISNGMNIRNVTVAVYDTNPFIPGERENSLRVLIRNIPLSVHESLILDELEKLKYTVIGTMTYQRLRVDGRLTDCLTGDRVVYIEQPSQPLPRDMTFGIFKRPKSTILVRRTRSPDRSLYAPNAWLKAIIDRNAAVQSSVGDVNSQATCNWTAATLLRPRPPRRVELVPAELYQCQQPPPPLQHSGQTRI